MRIDFSNWSFADTWQSKMIWGMTLEGTTATTLEVMPFRKSMDEANFRIYHPGGSTVVHTLNSSVGGVSFILVADLENDTYSVWSDVGQTGTYNAIIDQVSAGTDLSSVSNMKWHLPSNGMSTDTFFAINKWIISDDLNSLMLGSNLITLTNRGKTDVSDQELIDSDMLVVDVLTENDPKTYQYKYLEQSTKPTQSEWDAAEYRPFHKKMFFYREPVTQWVYLNVTLSDSSTLEKAFGLQGGVLTSPPDDPIDPWAYTKQMKQGFDTSWGWARGLNNLQEQDIVAVHAAGFGHIRYRDGAEPENLYPHLDWQLELILRHNLMAVITWCGTQGYTDISESEKQHGIDWWSEVSDHYKYQSHRVAYNIFVENVGDYANWTTMNDWFEPITSAIRATCPQKNIVYSGPGCNAPSLLDGFIVPSLAGENYFMEWHVWAGGIGDKWGGKRWTTGTPEEKAVVDQIIADAVSWTETSNKPTWLGAWMPSSSANNNVTEPEMCGFAEYVLQGLNAAGIPSAMNALPHLYYDDIAHEWRVDRLELLEVLNGDASIDKNDRDGDGISNNDEINIYGTNPDHADSDRDNIFDGYEIAYGFNPLDSSDGDPDHNDATASDNDNDGMNDAVEIHHGFNPTNPADADEDPDGDGLINKYELLAPNNPSVFKTSRTYKLRDALEDFDNDGWGTLNELLVGRKPNVRYGDPNEVFNNKPTAVADTVTAAINVATVIDVLANDTDADQDQLSIKEVYVGEGAVIINSNNTLTYTPPVNFTGADNFEYVVGDGKGYSLCSVAVNVTGEPIPLPGKASSPTPAHSSYNISRSTTLNWTAGSDAVSHDVYFGTSSTNLTFKGNQSGTSFSPGPLARRRNYYWRVDEVNSTGTTTGTVWQFKTGK